MRKKNDKLVAIRITSEQLEFLKRNDIKNTSEVIRRLINQKITEAI